MARRAPQAQLAPSNARGGLVNPVGGSARIGGSGELNAALSDASKGLSSIGDMFEAQNVQRDSLTAVKLNEQFKGLTNEALAQLDPLDPEYNTRVEEIYKTAGDSVRMDAQFKTQKVADAFELSITQQSEGGLTLAGVTRRSALDAEGKRLRGEAEDSAYASIRKDPDGYDAYLTEFGSKAVLTNTSINPKDVPALNEKFADNAVVARAEGYALKGQFDKAKQVLDANQNVLSPEAFRNGKRLVREQETQQRQAFLSDTAARAADIEIKIIDAKTVADFARLRGEVETLAKQGFFAGREDKRVSMIRQIESQREQLIKEQTYTASRLDQFDRGVGLDNQKDADLVWEHISDRYKQTAPNAPASQWAAWAGQYAANSGWVPSQYKRIMSNAERTDNVELIESAARVYDTFKKAAPDADTGTRETGSRVRLVSSARELLGIDYPQAAQLVLDRAPDAATLKARQDGFDKEFKDFDSRKALVNAGVATDGWFSKPDQVPEQVARSYERSLRLHYDLVGEKSIAEAAANKRFKEEYGVTAIGGARTVARFPAESFLPGAANKALTGEQRSAVINADIESGLKMLGITPGVVVAKEIDDTSYDMEGQAVGSKKQIVDASGIAPYSLVADPTTEQDIGSGRAVTYELRVRNSFGVHVPVPVQKDGRTQNLRFTMPSTEDLKKNPEYQKILKDALDSATTKRDFIENVVKPDMSRYPYGPRKKKAQ